MTANTAKLAAGLPTQATANNTITVTEAARRTGCSPQRIRALISQQRIDPKPARHGVNYMLDPAFRVLPSRGRARPLTKMPR